MSAFVASSCYFKFIELTLKYIRRTHVKICATGEKNAQELCVGMPCFGCFGCLRGNVYVKNFTHTPDVRGIVPASIFSPQQCSLRVTILPPPHYDHYALSFWPFCPLIVVSLTPHADHICGVSADVLPKPAGA